jgi:hypothetical protein
MELWRVFMLFYEKIGGSMKTKDRDLTQPQGKEVYSDCLKPDGCVFCGGNCPYNTDSVETVGSS